MKLIAVFLILAFIFVGDSKGGDSSSSEETDLEDLAKMVQQKLNSSIVTDIKKLIEKVQKTCPDIEDQLETTSDDVVTCIDNIALGSETFCSLIRNNFIKCSKPAVDLITKCLPEESKDLAVIGNKILLAVIDQACNSTVEQLLELLNPCWKEKDFSSFPACTDIKTTIQQYRDKLPSTSLICSMLPKVKNCEKAHQEASCPNPITKQAYLQFHEAIEAATKEDCDSLNKA